MPSQRAKRSGGIGCVQLNAENGPAAQAVCGEAGVIWDAGTAIRAGGMPVFRHDGRRWAGDICRKQRVATALAHWVEVVVSGLLQDVLKGTGRGARFKLLFKDLCEFKSVAIGNIDSCQLAHIGSPIFFVGVGKFAGIPGAGDSMACRRPLSVGRVKRGCGE